MGCIRRDEDLWNFQFAQKIFNLGLELLIIIYIVLFLNLSMGVHKGFPVIRIYMRGSILTRNESLKSGNKGFGRRVTNSRWIAFVAKHTICDSARFDVSPHITKADRHTQSTPQRKKGLETLTRLAGNELIKTSDWLGLAWKQVYTFLYYFTVNRNDSGKKR